MCFNKIPNYHVINNSCADLMHDLFDGICRYEIAEVLSTLIFKKRCFSLEMLNSRLKNFDFGRFSNRNIPLSISEKALKKGNLILSASEMVFLVPHLGILIGDLVTLCDEFWELFLS